MAQGQVCHGPRRWAPHRPSRPGKTLGREVKPDHRNADRNAILLQPRDLKRESASKRILRHGEPKSEKAPLAQRQQVSILMRLQPLCTRTASQREGNRLIDIRRRETIPSHHEIDVGRRKGPATLHRMQLDANRAAIVLARLQLEQTNSGDLHRDAIAAEDVTVRSRENSEFADPAAVLKLPAGTILESGHGRLPAVCRTVAGQ